MKYFDPYYFLIAFGIGFIYNYIIRPDPIILVKYPTPYNKDLIYKDSTNTCYKYNLKETSCPNDKTKIFKMPVQTV